MIGIAHLALNPQRSRKPKKAAKPRKKGKISPKAFHQQVEKKCPGKVVARSDGMPSYGWPLLARKLAKTQADEKEIDRLCKYLNHGTPWLKSKIQLYDLVTKLELWLSRSNEWAGARVKEEFEDDWLSRRR
jgi:hypothetical protein